MEWKFWRAEENDFDFSRCYLTAAADDGDDDNSDDIFPVY